MASSRGGTCAVGNLLSGALSWLVVVTVGLAPMLVYWITRVIGRALRRKPAPTAGPAAEQQEEPSAPIPPARRPTFR